MEEKENRGRGMAIASMVLGIVGLVLSCVVIGVVPCVIGLILGLVSVVKQKPGQGMAITGIVTSAIGIAFFIITLIGFISFTQELEVGVEHESLGYADPAGEAGGRYSLSFDDGVMVVFTVE